MLTAFLLTTLAFAGDCDQSNPELLVALDDAPPFSYKKGDRWTGISVDLWEEIAQSLDLNFTYVEQDFSESLGQLSNCTYDVVIPAVTISSERELLFDFSHSYMVEDVAVATNQVLSLNERTWLLIKEMLEPLLMVVSLIVSAAAFYFYTEKSTPLKSRHPCQSMLDSLYWSITTTSTVGYGDESPKTNLGKVVAMSWMLLSMGVVSTFTAKLIVEFQETHGVPQVEHLSTLKGRHVGTVAGTFSQNLLNEQGVPHIGYKAEKDLSTALTLGEVDYIVYDRTMLTYLLRDTDLLVLPETHYEQKLGFAVREDFPALEQVNRELLSLIKTDWWRGTTFRHTHGE